MRAALLLIASAFALALALPALAQTIAADAYVADGTEPEACTCSAANGPALACTLASVAGGVEPRCNVSPITTAGTYAVVIRVSRTEKITNTAGGGLFVPASEAASVPFAYTRGGAALPPPTGARLRTP